MSVQVQRPLPVASPAFEPPPRALDELPPGHPKVPDFQSILPILSRLPRQTGEATSPDDDGYDDDEYLSIEDGKPVAGTLPQSSVPVLYTAARLPSISPEAKEVWRAMHNLRSLTADYAGDFGSTGHSTAAARAETTESAAVPTGCPFSRSAARTRSALELVRGAFNWGEIRLPAEVEGVFYGVVFRSKRRDGSESAELYRMDKMSQNEAVRSGGLLVYWYGEPDPRTGANLATCVWSSREDAKIASALPVHREAAALSRRAYHSFELSRYAVIKRRGETGVTLGTWEEAYE